MKQKTLNNKVFLLLIALLGFNCLKAQLPGATSSNPIVLGSGNISIPSTTVNTTERWYEWNNTNIDISFKVKQLQKAQSNTLSFIEVYLNNSGSMSLEGRDTIRPDSTMRVFVRNFPTSSNVLIRLVTVSSICGSCTATLPVVSLEINNTAAVCAGYTQPSCELVVDGSFESFSVPCANLQWNQFPTSTQPNGNFYACYWQLPIGTQISSGNIGTPDYYNSCATYNSGANTTFNAHTNSNTVPTGNAYAGLFAYLQAPSNNLYREYITQQLSQPLIPGVSYTIKMQIQVSPNYCMGLKEMQAGFSFSQPTQIGTGAILTLPFVVNMSNVIIANQGVWQQLSATFVAPAGGNYNWLTLGNFVPSGSLTQSTCTPFTPNLQPGTYFYIDDVSIKPVAAQTLSIAATSTAVCIGQPVTLTASGGNNYNWQPGNITGNPVVFYPSVNTIYTLTGTDIYGCVANSSTISIAATQCCLPSAINLSNVNVVAPGGSPVVWNTLTNGNTYSGNVALPIAGYIIQGNYNVVGGLTISTPVIFQNTEMTYADAISVKQNATTTIDKSYWHGCDKNWQGIISTRSLTVKNSVIEDAAGAIQINATSATHQGLNVDNTIFNKNVYGMIITGPKLTSYKLTGSIFTSRDIPVANYVYTTGQRWTSLANFSSTSLNNYNPGYLKGSTVLSLPNTARGQVGIYFGAASLLITGGNPSGNITIGDASTTPALNTSYTNVFDYLRIGEYNSNSRLISYNNNFQWISSIPAADLYGSSTACVYNNSTPRAVIGSNSTGTGLNIYTNNFFSSTNGVYAANNGTLNVYNNQFTSITQYGVQVENWNCTNTQTVQIINNRFATCLYDLYAFNNNTIKLNFANSISTYPFVTVRARVTYHAYISEINKPSTAKYYVGYSNTTGKVNGVYCINTYSPAVVNNTITIRTPVGAGFNGNIWLDNTDQGDIKFNLLNVSPSNSQSYSTFGIFTNTGTNNLFCENNVKGAGSAMKFQGPSPSLIHRNNLNSNPSDPCLFGIFLDNNGSVGPIKYNTSCAENIFGDYNYGGGGADTYVQNSTGSNIDYPGLPNAANQYFPLVNTQIGGFLFNPVSNSSTGVAQCITQPMGPMMVQQSISASSSPTLSAGVPVIMNGALNFSANNLVNKTIANKSTFELARKLAINTTAIVGGSAFMNTNANNAIGSFYKMDSLVGRYAVTNNTATLNQAKNLNTALVAVGVIETNQKTFNTVYHLFMKDESLITTAHINSLKSLAALCPFTEGTSVYQARALIKHYDTTEFFNPCENNPVIVNNGNRFMNSNTELNQSKDALSTLIYPNPAGNEITVSTNVDGAKLFIFNLVGQMVLESDLNTLTKIDVSHLTTGSYIYKIIKDGKIIKVDKLVISK